VEPGAASINIARASFIFAKLASNTSVGTWLKSIPHPAPAAALCVLFFSPLAEFYRMYGPKR